MSKLRQFDFGFESRTTSWEDARIVLLFMSPSIDAEIGSVQGSLAVADASRYAEFYEMDGDFSPFEIGVYSEIVDGKDLRRNIGARVVEAIEQGKIPIVVVEDGEVILMSGCQDHMRIDFNVLIQGTPWYEFIDKLESEIQGSAIDMVELTGVGSVKPKSPEALLCAQIIIKTIGFIRKARA